MTQPNIFDYAESQRQRDKGMEAAEFSYGSNEWLIEARKIAEILASKNGEVTVEDVLRFCPRPTSVSVNATGSLFKGKKWVPIGFKSSTKISSHARQIRIWRLAD